MRKTAVLIIAGLVLTFLCGYLLGRPHGDLQPRTEVRVDTVHDTVTIAEPVPRDSVVLQYVTVKLPVAPSDTLSAVNYAQNELENMRDSSTVVLPITQTHYTDSAYDAWVSGFHAKLDSIRLYPPVITKTVTIYKPPNRWSVGVTGGYGITPKGLQPYIGIGVTYRLTK